MVKFFVLYSVFVLLLSLSYLMFVLGNDATTGGIRCWDLKFNQFSCLAVCNGSPHIRENLSSLSFNNR